MSLLRTRADDFLLENNIFMAETIGVRDATLARLAMVLVCFKPAVNRQPGFRR